MTSLDTAKAALRAIERGELDAFARHLADDAVCVGLAPHVMMKAECVRVFHALTAGMPDWSFNAELWESEGDRVGAAVEATATQTAVLPPLLPSVPPVLATGRHLRLPKTRVEFYFHDDKIVRIVFQNVPGGGVLGVLGQLGIQIHYAA
jgi:hypothetical protein